MAISIDWGTKVINVPRADLPVTQVSPEVRELDADWFRLQLKSLEDDADGMTFPDTHSHNTEVTLGGLVLARVIEIINGYTITFEDGQYSVDIVGANTNYMDVTNPNQVSLRSTNSAGLIRPDDFDIPSIADAVWDEDLIGHSGSGTFGSEVQDQGGLLLRILGLDQENFYIDQTQFISHEGASLMTQCRMRLYDSSVNVGTGSGVIATYQMVSTYLNGEMQTYKVTKQ
jgi:hypothetical protein